MFGYLVLLFTLLPAIELYVLIEVGSVIGASNTILIILLTGVVGAYLARLQGFLTLQKIQNSVNQGQLPNNELMDGLMILVGGIVLLTPGFITDIIGFLLLIPLSRNLIKIWAQKTFEKMMKEGNTIHIYRSGPSSGPSQKRYDDIDI